ncbi:hypothetical protein C5Y96_09285 [Blastopirellula marina]|uniref:Carboxypeptidase regulatory-like domain-containing protein n=1 Tax=Blastopirellula marina TaxID=124 RepID=A0A2S8FUH3_9BACT|nr:MULTISPECIES: carboxypeptidase-like regulatory domain-containing protein [Pirellulaceae]PQO35831.1 hypothetical protein C5Y96_09285 [Blastopirellula marina]RCS53406.1 carboxypeptidase regulatory-like domain-containing protein [Bremerella cremea]
MPLVICVGWLLLSGCTSEEAGKPLGAVVTGTVTYNGSPVEGAMITFRPASEGIQGAFARTDAAGKFELSTSNAGTSGVSPGNYLVTVTKTEVPQSTAASEDDPNYNPNAKPAEPKSLLPKKYASAKTSGLEFTVTDGSNEIPLELKD